MAQTDISWHSCLLGWLHNSWERQQATLFQSIKSRKSAKRWTGELIQKLWDIGHRVGSVGTQKRHPSRG